MAATINPLQKLLDVGLSVVTNLIGSLFGKSKTKKKLEALSQEAAYLAQVDRKQSQTLTFLFIGLGIAIFALIIFFIRRRK